MSNSLFRLAKTLARFLLIPILAAIGVPLFLRALRRAFRPQDTCVLILIYHRLCDPQQTHFRYQSETLGVAPDRFAAQIDYLTRVYSIVPLKRAVESLKKGGPALGEAVVLTFDDGYRDNLTEGLPILRRHRTPATIFLATDFISDRPTWMWNDRLAPLLESVDLEQLQRHEAKFPSTQLFERLIAYQTLSFQQKRAEINLLAEELKTLSEANKEKVLELLANANPTGRPLVYPAERLMLSWSEVRDLSAENISMGAHTCSHPILTKVSSDQSEREIRQSGQIVSTKLGLVACPAFAFPNGRPSDIPENSREILTRGNYFCACTTTQGINHAGVDPYNLKRVSVSNLRATEFSLLIEYWFMKSWLFGPRSDA